MALDALAIADLADLEKGPRDTWSRGAHDSQVRITMDVNDDDEMAMPPFVIEMTSQLGGQSARHRVHIFGSVPKTVQEFQAECQRLSSSFNRYDFRQHSQTR